MIGRHTKETIIMKHKLSEEGKRAYDIVQAEKENTVVMGGRLVSCIIDDRKLSDTEIKAEYERLKAHPDGWTIGDLVEYAESKGIGPDRLQIECSKTNMDNGDLKEFATINPSLKILMDKFDTDKNCELGVDIFERQVSVFKSVTEKEPLLNTTIWNALNPTKARTDIQAIRDCEDLDLKKELKKKMFAFTASGICNGTRKKENMAPNGILCIDIDGKDNPNREIQELKTLVSDIDCVAYAGLSISGNGVFALIPINDKGSHEACFRALQRDFKEIGIIIDNSCKDISRLRFMSFDDDAYYNRAAMVYTEIMEEIYKPVDKNIPRHRQHNEGNTGISLLIEALDRTRRDITGNYAQWIRIGAGLYNEFGESGRGYFHDISKYHPKYSVRETNKKYDKCKTMTNCNIGTVFYIAKNEGII